MAKPIDDAIEYLIEEAARIDRALAALRDLKRGIEAGEANNLPQDSEPSHREIVEQILEEAGKALATGEIAKIARKGNLIKSSVGYKGIYSAVYSTLFRQKNAFFHRPDGRWDLQVRRARFQSLVRNNQKLELIATPASIEISEKQKDEKSQTSVH